MAPDLSIEVGRLLAIAERLGKDYDGLRDDVDEARGLLNHIEEVHRRCPHADDSGPALEPPTRWNTPGEPRRWHQRAEVRSGLGAGGVVVAIIELFKLLLTHKW
jgi:hypothetical protein